MELLLGAFSFIMHLDKHLAEVVQSFGSWSYLLLFLIIFAETGLVITPILPGDSLLFVVGAFAASGTFDLALVFILLTSAAILGDTVNYAIGKYFGTRILLKGGGKFFKKEYLDQTHKFYEKHGCKTIILARFVPIVRTFAPFVAGMGTMDYRKFLVYNITGAFLWMLIFVLGGYFFGNIPIVKKNFMFVILGVMAVSILPIIFAFVSSLKKTRN